MYKNLIYEFSKATAGNFLFAGKFLANSKKLMESPQCAGFLKAYQCLKVYNTQLKLASPISSVLSELLRYVVGGEMAITAEIFLN